MEKDVEKDAGSPSLTSTHNLGEESPSDPNIIDFDGPDDPDNPMNWHSSKKWGMVALISAITFLTPLASSQFAPGVPDVMREFHSTSELLAGFMVSIYVLGFAFGPLIIAPLSEMYGRLPLYHSCNFLFIIFTIAAAVAANMTQFIVFRFFMGCRYFWKSIFDQVLTWFRFRRCSHGSWWRNDSGSYSAPASRNCNGCMDDGTEYGSLTCI